MYLQLKNIFVYMYMKFNVYFIKLYEMKLSTTFHKILWNFMYTFITFNNYRFSECDLSLLLIVTLIVFIFIYLHYFLYIVVFVLLSFLSRKKY